MKTSLILALFSVFSLFTTSQQLNNSFDPETSVVAIYEEGALVLAVDEATIITSAKNGDENWAEITSVQLKKADEATAYLILKGTNSEELRYLLAIVLETDGNGQYRIGNGPNPVKHSCSQHCCQECEFNYVEGKIKGCKCVRLCPFPNTAGGGAYCGHSISTSSGMAPVGE